MKNYKPFLWRRLRAKLFVAGLLNCTEDVPKYRSSDTDTPTMMFDETDLHNAVALKIVVWIPLKEAQPCAASLRDLESKHRRVRAVQTLNHALLF